MDFSGWGPSDEEQLPDLCRLAHDSQGRRVDLAALSRGALPARDVGRAIAVALAGGAFQPIR